MADLAGVVRTRLGKGDREGAMAELLTAWARTRARELAELVEVLAAQAPITPFEGTTTAWLAAARKAKRPDDRGRLLDAVRGRSMGDTNRCLAAAVKWRDPRLTAVFHELLSNLPWVGRRSTGGWREILDALAQHGDPRAAELAALPASWGSGPTETTLANLLKRALRELPPSVAPEPSLTALLAELRASATPTHEETLLAAIYAHPDDDAPRLVYADWLLERGDERGELITLQLGGERSPATDARERALLDKYGKRWLGPLAGQFQGKVEFRRGFPAKGTVTFRNRRDVEHHGAHPGWATLEELGWSDSTTRHSQRDWTRYLTPAMRGLRRAIRPAPMSVLSAPHAWRLEWLELDGINLDADTFREVIQSPLLPRLQQLYVSGLATRRYGPRPEWLQGVKRCPPHLVIETPLESRTRDAWLAAAEKTPLESLTFYTRSNQYFTERTRDRSRFTRDKKGKLTCLDVELELVGVRKLNPKSHDVLAVIAALKTLVAGSLTQFTATVDIGGTRVVAEPLVAAGLAKLRTTSAPKPKKQ